MITDYKVGDRISLRSDSRWIGVKDNPPAWTEGVITHLYPRHRMLPIVVRWPSGKTLMYDPKDLNFALAPVMGFDPVQEDTAPRIHEDWYCDGAEPKQEKPKKDILDITRGFCR